MKNLTPENMRCDVGASCPGVYELADGRLLIVGAESDTLEGIDIGLGEAVVIIDRALLSEVLRDNKPAP